MGAGRLTGTARLIPGVRRARAGLLGRLLLPAAVACLAVVGIPGGQAAQAAAGAGGAGGQAYSVGHPDRRQPATAAAASPATTTFSERGTYRYAVPAGLTRLTVVAVGGPGGSCPAAGSAGGGGAAVTAVVSVTPGQVLSIQVGGAGADCGAPGGGDGGFGGGGDGGAGEPGHHGGAGGGGASSVQAGATPLVWAGGGGGAGGSPTARGGSAAGTNGDLSADMNGGNGGGRAGTQASGGTGSSGNSGPISGASGARGTGGSGASASACRATQRLQDGGGGGGGGYFGGGGGGFAGPVGTACSQAAGPGGGGGGSSFVAGSATVLIDAAVSSSPPGVSITESALPIGGAVQCIHEPATPAPGPGEAVFARPAGNNALPNVIIVPAGARWTASSCEPGGRNAATQVMDHPTAIRVGTGAAVLLESAFSLDTDRGLLNRYSPWGAVSTTATAPVLFPGVSDWDTTAAEVVGPAYLLQVFGSCRSCAVPGLPSAPVQARLPSVVAYQGDVSGADMSGARWQAASLDGWNFSGADLSGAQLQGASLTGATFAGTAVTGTSFGAADLRGAAFTSLQYARPPSFSGATVGEVAGRCTVFRNTDLVAASFSPRYAGDCANSPLLPGSSVSTEVLYFVTQVLHARIDLAGAQFVSSASTRALLAGRDLSRSNLDGVRFTGFPVDLTRADLDGASLRGASLDYAILAGASFHNVDASGSSFRGAQLQAAGRTPAAAFAGSSTDLQRADFVDADVSGANFSAADLTGAVFSHALAAGTDFNGVRASGADFDGAHIYGNGQAFANATNLRAADFSNAVLAGNIDQGGGFALTRTDLTGARFVGTECVSCNFTGSRLAAASFSGAYLPGAVFSGVVSLSGANFVNAWLYCGDLANGSCAAVRGQPGRWLWPLDLGVGEAFGPVPFATTNLTGVSLDDVAVCPDGKSGSVAPAGCTGHLLPRQARAPVLPAPCSAAGREACPTATSTVFDAGVGGAPLAVAAATSATWATVLSPQGYYVALGDGTVRLVGAGAPRIVAGQAGRHCTDPSAPCGDGGAATSALLGTPVGLAVGLDGSVYVADAALHRVRRIAPDGQITTVAGDGGACTTPPTFNGTVSRGCGDGGAATAAQLAGPFGVWVSPDGVIYVADGPRGLRLVSATTGNVRTLPGTAAYDLRAVVGDGTGALYAAADNPDYLVKIVMTGPDATVTRVVGTGTSGYNGNTTPFGSLAPGTAVRINQPQGLSVGIDGDIVFADGGNGLVRAYEPRSGHVSDVLGGLVSGGGVPQPGFNGDGRPGDQTRLDRPMDAVATAAGTYVVADTGNHRVREFGPNPLDD